MKAERLAESEMNQLFLLGFSTRLSALGLLKQTKSIFEEGGHAMAWIGPRN
jgi:hypothetical protein